MRRLFALLYTVLICCLTPIAFGVVLWRGVRTRGYWAHLAERFGCGAGADSSTGATPVGADAGTIWIHAVSLGEVTAAAALIRALQERHPALRIELTTATPTGRARAHTLFRDSIGVRYLPYDTPGSVRRFLTRVRPAVAVIMETELWPTLFGECARRGVPVLLASARLSVKSVARYRRLGRLFSGVFSSITLIAAQTREDAERFVAIGADARRVSVVGNVKFDMDVSAAVVSQGRALRAGNWPLRPVWVAGSTHAGEEEQVLTAHAEILSRWPDALLLLAPRHPDRFGAVADLLARRGLRFQRRTSGGANVDGGVTAEARVVQPDTQALLVDTVGELVTMYAAADAVFVGGSLVPIGGHNLLEPALLGLPVLTGPSQSNSREIAQLLLQRDAALQVDDAADLATQLLLLLGAPERRRALGENALRVVAENRGSVARLLEIIETLRAGASPSAGANPATEH